MPTFDPVIIQEKLGSTVVVEYEDGSEEVAVIVNEETIFTADENDIRAGKIAATGEGVTEGTKVIPSYHTTEGFQVITSGSAFVIPLATFERYDYTKLQCIICPYSGSIEASVAAEKVAINEGVYAVNSADVIATVIKDSENKRIDLGIANESGSLYLLRFFTYKEII